MLDHGQLGPPTPAVALSPVVSRRPSTGVAGRRASQPRSRHGSTGRRPSIEGGVFAGLAASLSMSALETDDEDDKPKVTKPPSRRASGTRSPRAAGTHSPRHSESRPRRPSFPGLTALSSLSMSVSAIDSDDEDGAPTRAAKMNGAKSPAATGTIAESKPAAQVGEPPAPATGGLQSPADLAAQLYANPKLAALRSPSGMSMTPIQTAGARVDKASISPPILANSKCSGYFVEPVCSIPSGLYGDLTCMHRWNG
jgi:dual specificity phosphatase 12